MTIQDLKDVDAILRAIDMAKNDPVRPLVVINCITYNHAPYLAQCLEGFVMQKTNFPFVALVHDDASPDGTAEVLREYTEKYPDIIKPICDPTNRYCDKSLDLIMNEWINAYEPKYIAFCEGDDYWIDPFKLQKQVDILSSNPNIGVCYSRAKIFHQNMGIFDNNIGGGDFRGFKSQLLTEPIMTLTTMFRKDLYSKYYQEIKPNMRNWLMGDTPMWLWFSIKSKIAFIEDITSVYRVLDNSASHSTDYYKQKKFNKSLLDIRLFFINNYCPEDKKIKVKVIDDYHKRNMIASLKAYEIKEYYRNCFLLKEQKIKDYLRPIYYFLLKKI